MTYEEVAEMLSELVDEIPPEILKGLNGGIVLFKERKVHPESKGNDLLIMGQYEQSVLGKMVKIYYGSFVEVYSHLSPKQAKEQLRDILHHELTHHLETLAGESDLVREDNEFMREYRERRGIDE